MRIANKRISIDGYISQLGQVIHDEHTPTSKPKAQPKRRGEDRTYTQPQAGFVSAACQKAGDGMYKHQHCHSLRCTCACHDGGRR